MQSLTLNNLLIHDITQADGLGYALHTPITGIDFPTIRLASQDKPGEHGAIVSNQLYGGRQMTLTGIVWASSVSTYNSRRRSLQAAIRIVKNNFISLPLLCKFVTDDGLSLQFLCYASQFQLDEQELNHGNYLMGLFAPDPNFYNQTSTTHTIAVSATVTFANNGDANTYPVFTFNGPLTNPIITNTTTGETFKLDETILSSHSVVVDMQNKTIIRDGTINDMAAFDVANTWLSLVPGNNSISLTDSSGAGNVSGTYRDAWIGI